MEKALGLQVGWGRNDELGLGHIELEVLMGLATERSIK